MPRMTYCAAVRRIGDTFSSRPNIWLPAFGFRLPARNAHLDQKSTPLPPLWEIIPIVIRSLGTHRTSVKRRSRARLRSISHSQLHLAESREPEAALHVLCFSLSSKK